MLIFCFYSKATQLLNVKNYNISVLNAYRTYTVMILRGFSQSVNFLSVLPAAGETILFFFFLTVNRHKQPPRFFQWRHLGGGGKSLGTQPKII